MVDSQVLEPLNNFVNKNRSNPCEACALIVQTSAGDFIFIEAANVAPNPYMEFLVDPKSQQLAKQQGEIKYVIHTHPSTIDTASADDIAGCNSCKIPYIIYSYVTGKKNTIYPQSNPGIYNVPYLYGIDDCWTLVVKLYKEKLGINLFDPMIRPVYTDDTGLPIFEQLASKAGFRKLSDNEELEDMDCLLFTTNGSGIINHVGCFTEGKLAHHLRNRYAELAPYSNLWRKLTVARYRYIWRK